MLHHYYMLQVTIMQKGAGSQLEEHLSLWQTNLRPAGKIRGLKWKYCVLDPEINAVVGFKYTSSPLNKMKEKTLFL